MRWTKPSVNEALATLYLRLNGYFATGLILHSPAWGESRTEVDCVAIRHPKHSQPERGVDCSKFLAITRDEVDILICEVKSVPERPTFNEALRTDVEAISALVRWVGVFGEERVASVAQRLQPLLQSGVSVDAARGGVVEGEYRVRPLLCCAPCTEVQCTNQWCLVGTEIFRFIDECFNPSIKRDSCSTRYNFLQWGYALTPLVEYFKNVAGVGTSNLADLYKHLKAS